MAPARSGMNPAMTGGLSAAAPGDRLALDFVLRNEPLARRAGAGVEGEDLRDLRELPGVHQVLAQRKVAQRCGLGLAAVGGVVGHRFTPDVLHVRAQGDVVERVVCEERRDVAEVALRGDEGVPPLDLLRRHRRDVAHDETVPWGLVGDERALIGRQREPDAGSGDGVVAECRRGTRAPQEPGLGISGHI